jgi:uncharacterized membrane protein YidH (DUF202 family)
MATGTRMNQIDWSRTTRRSLAILAAALALTGTARAAQDCDRTCLIGLTDTYLAAMVAHDPARAPVAATARFTENTRVTKLGEGSAWTNITGMQGYKLYVADPAAAQVALYTVMDGKERPAILTLRLKVADRRITEIESVYVGIGQTGLGSLDNLKTVAPVWNEVLPPAKRRTREEMIAITDRYFATLEDGHKDYIPFTDDCLRVENGVITAGNSRGQGIGAMGCKDNLNQPIWAYITHVQPRRYLAVDVERGLVSGMFMFRHAGTESSYIDSTGKTVPFSAAMLKKQAVVIAELFKIEDGKIRRIEAVMTGNLELDAPSGWGE